jgi:putative toxin-antitoxin system antitoxin component (TIGR02293 family)
MSAEAKRVVAILGGPKVLGSRVRTFEDLKARIREGLPYRAVTALARSIDETAVRERELSEALGLPTLRTLKRRQRPNRLDPGESDRVVRMARVIAHAIEILGDRDKAAAWVDRRNRALGGETPLSLLDTDIGVGEVEDVLGRMEHGVFS